MHNRALEFYIDGKWVKPQSDARLEVINPATEEPIGEIAIGNEKDVDLAVEAALKAFESFGQTTPKERKVILERCLVEYEKRVEDIAQALTAELGAPIEFSRRDQTGAGSWHLGGFLEDMDRVDWDKNLPDGDRLRREPIGVVGCITPWNWPLNQIALKVFAAIAAGCTIVLKPSEITPYNALIFAEVMDAAEVPAGVFNMVQGLGLDVGAAMSKHPNIDMMSFTGSTRAGAAVTADSAPFVKRVALELGGKSPNVVFADCEDLEERVRDGVAHCMENTGQSCNAPTRMIVERKVYDQAVIWAQDQAEKTAVIHPQDKGFGLGPLVSELQFNKVQDLIQKGIDEGARLLTGGTGRPEGFNRGYFVRPTIFADVTQDMTIWKEEIFGPVLAMCAFDEKEEALALANDTPYGLAAYVQTGSKETAEYFARGMRAGMVRINGAGMQAGSPFGGYKQSGNGREGGIFGIEDFLEIKLIARPNGFL